MYFFHFYFFLRVPPSYKYVLSVNVKKCLILGKMVTFETPLMFSRSSSIASLGSCEPQEGFIGSSAVSECRFV